MEKDRIVTTNESRSRVYVPSSVQHRTLTLGRVLDIVAMLVLVLGAIVMVLPFMWMFSTSLRPAAESFRLPPAWFPTQWHFENYTAVFHATIPILTFAANSVKVTLSVLVGQLITCSMAGYAFARLRFPGRNILFVLLLASLMVPGQVTIIPVFIIMRKLGLVDNLGSIILPFLTSAFGVFLLRQHFLTMPQDLFDAAKMDGAGQWMIFRRIAIPLSGPALSALGILTFNSTWNNYFYPLIFLNTAEKMTLPLGITALRGSLGSGNASVVMAAITMAVLPILLVFLFAQRWFIAGITQTGLKG